MPIPAEGGGAADAAQEMLRMIENLQQVQEGLAHASRNLAMLVRNLQGIQAPAARVNEELASLGRNSGTASEALQQIDRTFVGLSDKSARANATMADLVKMIDRKTKVDLALATVDEKETEAVYQLTQMHGKAAQQIKQAAIPAFGKWIDQMGALGGGSPVVGKFLTFMGQLPKTIATASAALSAFGAAIGVTAAVAAPILAVIVAVGIAVAQTIARFKEAQQMLGAFGGTAAGSEVSVRRLTAILLVNQEEMALLGVEAADLSKAYEGLTKSYGISAGGAREFGVSMMKYSEQSAYAITRTLGMAKVTGVSADQVTRFVSVMGVLGEDVRKSDLVFGKAAAAATRAGVNVSDVTDALVSLGTANIFVQRPLDKMLGSLGSFSEGIMTSSSALFTGANRAKLAADAMRAVADASAKLDMPTILAFGGVMQGMTGTMDEILTRASKLDRAEIFKTALETVGTAAAPGQRIMAKSIMAMQLGIGDLNTALSLGASEATRTRLDSGRRSREAVDKTTELVNLARTLQLSLKNIEKATVGLFNQSYAGRFGNRIETAPSPTSIAQQQMNSPSSTMSGRVE